jgi:hypothetical protein
VHPSRTLRVHFYELSACLAHAAGAERVGHRQQQARFLRQVAALVVPREVPELDSQVG